MGRTAEPEEALDAVAGLVAGAMAPDPGRRRRIGIFGGTFDPPHVGHVSAACDVADALDLDEVLWVPAGRPPHKPDDVSAPAELRVAMAREAAAADPRFRVSEVELRRPGPSYTVDTLRELLDAEKAKAPGDEAPELVLIIGHDQYRTFDRWRAPEEIRRLATLAVMDRGGERLLAADPDEVVRVPVRRIDVSSTEVRARIERGEDVSALVPEEVLRVIRAEGLYRR
jgi:nicotinate-nucleotide adenylyltransferase